MNKKSQSFQLSETVAAHTPREKILYVALRLFAENGFKKTSVREIAKESSANVAAIAYYFGDKEGLYRAAFTEPLEATGTHCGVVGGLNHLGQQPTATHVLQMFYSNFLAPLSAGEHIKHVMRLQFREMIEPTGLWSQMIENEIQPGHQAMVKMLVRELELKKPDVDVQRLAVSLLGLAVHCFVGQDVIAHLAPGVLATPKAIEQTADRLVMYGVAMIQAEKQRRLNQKFKEGTQI
jgi:TetR/AcrR family transcriptional regulator, regulator of cefoperazone and chloramphenicol sensitivity